jgi:hypothetical protein
MSRMRITIHCIFLAIGIFLVLQGGTGLTGPIAVWSDFKAYSARVARDDTAKHALAYGGEKEGTDFDYLLDQVWSLSQHWKRVIQTGVILCAVAVVGIGVELAANRKRKRIESARRGLTQ